MCLHMYVCSCMYILAFARVYACAHVHLSVCMSVPMCPCDYLNVCIHMCMCKCVSVCVPVYMYACGMHMCCTHMYLTPHHCCRTEIIHATHLAHASISPSSPLPTWWIQRDLGWTTSFSSYLLCDPRLVMPQCSRL